MKELFHFADWYHQLTEETLVKCIMRVSNLGAVSLVLNATEWKSKFGLTQEVTGYYGTVTDGYCRTKLKWSHLCQGQNGDSQCRHIKET